MGLLRSDWLTVTRPDGLTGTRSSLIGRTCRRGRSLTTCLLRRRLRRCPPVTSAACAVFPPTTPAAPAGGATAAASVCARTERPGTADAQPAGGALPDDDGAAVCPQVSEVDALTPRYHGDEGVPAGLEAVPGWFRPCRTLSPAHDRPVRNLLVNKYFCFKMFFLVLESLLSWQQPEGQLRQSVSHNALFLLF